MTKSKYKIHKDIPVGAAVERTENHPLWDVAKKMEIGDCVIFNTHSDKERAEASVLMRFLTTMYGVSYNQTCIRPWTSKTQKGLRTIWRIDPNEKIKAREAKK
jgi:hypothetical protein